MNVRERYISVTKEIELIKMITDTHKQVQRYISALESKIERVEEEAKRHESNAKKVMELIGINPEP